MSKPERSGTKHICREIRLTEDRWLINSVQGHHHPSYPVLMGLEHALHFPHHPAYIHVYVINNICRHGQASLTSTIAWLPTA